MRYELDTHTHTIASGHAYNTMTEMVHAAAQKGLKMLAITDHGPAIPGASSHIYFQNIRAIDKSFFEIPMFFGIELNVLDFKGTVDVSDVIISRLDYVQVGFHIDCYTPGNIEENTSAMLGICDNPYIDTIVHPDDSGMPLDYEKLVKRCSETGTMLEVNENSFRMPGLRKNCEENVRTYLRLCRKYGVPITIGSDAHFCTAIGEHFRVEKILESENFPEELVMNADAEKFRAYIESRHQKRGVCNKKEA